MDRPRPRRVLAVASSGGHWIQLRRLEPAFAGHDVAWLKTHPGHRDEVAPARFHTVADANRRSKAALVRSALKIAWVLLRERPDVVVSTGAAPGYLAIRGAPPRRPHRVDRQRRQRRRAAARGPRRHARPGR